MYKNYIHKIFLTVTVFLIPFMLHAQALKNIAVIFVNLLNSAVSVIMGISVVAFIVGLVRFISTAGDEKSRTDGKQLMVWGTISLFVMVSVWGLVAIIKTTFLY